MSGLLPTEAPFAHILLEGVQDSETDGLLEACEVARAALDADIAASDIADPTGALYIVLGSGARVVTEVTLVRESGGWAVSDVRRAPANSPHGLLRPAPAEEPLEDGIVRVRGLGLSDIWRRMESGVEMRDGAPHVPVLSFDGRVGDRPAPTLDLHPVAEVA